MTDVVSIVIAVVSLVGSLIATGFTGWITYYVDEVKRRADAKKLVIKYRDPLLLAALDLQSRIWNLVQQNLLRFHAHEDKRDLIYVYTAFLVGQFLSWTYILRREAQFLRFSTQKNNRELARNLEALSETFSTDSRPGEEPFMLWRGQQMAIGEIMTVGDGGQLYCMGYSTFSHKYKNEPDFHRWFIPIEKSIDWLVDAHQRRNRAATHRLRRLQHLLIDLIKILDEEGVGEGKEKRGYVTAAPACECNGCSRAAPVSPSEKDGPRTSAPTSGIRAPHTSPA
ncbi:hypothetical protein BP5796_01166 [Coleophoma crateriformis]|uniref:Uncharacterized protein n=1 Tax=Coleophoma crateriformis TaxID=565419 RepID=A0A3D8SZN0_9HELO|nr:hypothetical protein BP5796_01166 [Coleophoma crateriformis]